MSSLAFWYKICMPWPPDQVAIKRCSILLSVLAGGYIFRESIRSRLPYIALMMGGMCLIVLEPNSASLHQAHT